VLIALGIEFPTVFAETARNFLMFQRRHLSRQGAKSWRPPSSTVSLLKRSVPRREVILRKQIILS
jgi:hypothetical protein